MSSQSKVPILRLPFDDDDTAYLQAGIETILASGMLTLSRFTQEFEEAFTSFAGSRFALAVTNGTAALDLIFRGLGIRDSTVIVPTNTFLASALAPMQSGNRVVFADADPETLCLDPADVRRKITDETSAVVMVHIGGVMSLACHELRELCEEKGIYLIEDAAHAHGCTLDGKPAGSIGHAAGFSMFPTKVLTTGEGGVVTTDDEGLYNKVSMMRNQGKNPRLGGAISEFGHNFRMSEVTALFGVRQMEKAAQVIEERQNAARFYDAALSGIENVRPIKLPAGTTSSYYKYVCYLGDGIDRGDLKRIMRDEHGVSLTGEVYATLCHQEPIWDGYTYCGRPKNGDNVVCLHGKECLETQGEFPGAQRVADRHICLPVYPGLSEGQLHQVVESLDQTLGHLS